MILLTKFSGVLFLDGCYFEEIHDHDKNNKFGFAITHKSQSFPTHHLYSESKELINKWLENLRVFET